MENKLPDVFDLTLDINEKEYGINNAFNSIPFASIVSPIKQSIDASHDIQRQPQPPPPPIEQYNYENGIPIKSEEQIDGLFDTSVLPDDPNFNKYEYAYMCKKIDNFRINSSLPSLDHFIDFVEMDKKLMANASRGRFVTTFQISTIFKNGHMYDYLQQKGVRYVDIINELIKKFRHHIWKYNQYFLYAEIKQTNASLVNKKK